MLSEQNCRSLLLLIHACKQKRIINFEIIVIVISLTTLPACALNALLERAVIENRAASAPAVFRPDGILQPESLYPPRSMVREEDKGRLVRVTAFLMTWRAAEMRLKSIVERRRESKSFLIISILRF